MHGYVGRILHVDLTGGAVTIETPDEALYRHYLGGSALGLRYVLRDTPAGADALGPDNTLTFAVGPLAGAPISGQSRVAVNARSPRGEGGAVGDSQMGGFFPAELKFAGFDAIVVRGQALRPVYLWVHDGAAELRDAAHLWGRDTADTQDALRAELGDAAVEIAQCGTAGERLTRFAAIITRNSRAAGRTGLGAVMGAKRLKAIAVRGHNRPSAADPARLRTLSRDGVEGMRANPAMLGLRAHGTGGALAAQQEIGGLPTHNWARGVFAGSERIDGVTFSDELLLRNDTCHACAVRCKRVARPSPWGVDPRYGGPEYEALALFGAGCGVDDLEALALANQRCNAHGLDTISTAAAIAFAMDCFTHGRINGTQTDGVELEFGDAEALLWALDRIITREGIGDVLAEGTEHAARVWGADDLRVTVKGGELPAHMPQAKRSLALIYAVNPFGPDHHASEHDHTAASDNSAEERRRLALLGVERQLDPTDLGPDKVRFAFTTQKFYSLLDCAAVCGFVYGPAWQLYGPDHLIEALNAVTGWDLTLEEALTIGERRLNMLRLFNAREGIGRAADTLPRKLFAPLAGGGPTGGARLTPAELDDALDSYYALAGWDPLSGMPTPETLTRLAIER